MKYYVVRSGRQTGIFDNWTETQAQVSWFQGAQFKSFPSLEAAQFAREYGDRAQKGKLNPQYLRESLGSARETSIATDAACPSNPGPVEYRGVITSTQEEIFAEGPLEWWTVNIGEFVAIVHGLSWIIQNNKPYKILFSDSKIACARVLQGKANTSIARTLDHQQLRKLVDRAESWLANNPNWSEHVTLSKRKTSQRGEIPADFGRK